MSTTYTAHFELTEFKDGKGYQIVGHLEGSIGSKDEFVWKAPADSTITIMFPPSRDPLGIGCTTVDASDPLTRKLARAEAPDNLMCGKYRYAIFCHKTNNFAIMNSDPEIIIND